MGFFWSGRNASIEGIFRRSMRYWLVSYVGNCLKRSDLRREIAQRQMSSFELEAQIQDRVNRERAEGRYDGPGSGGYHEGRVPSHRWVNKGTRPAATRGNGGLRGSKATRRRAVGW